MLCGPTQKLSDAEPLIEVRVGIESGEVVLRRLDMGRGPASITLGHTVNLAARLQTVSPPGSISIGEQTKRLVEGYFELTALPSVSLKGLTDPVPIYEVTGLGRLRQHSQISARREFSKFVNRTDELVQLRRALERAMAKQGQLVSMVTDAGAGKSRLVLEFSRTLPPGCKVIEAYAVSHGRKIPWDPVIRMLGEYFGILEFDDPPARRNRIAYTLAGLGPEIRAVQALLFRLLGIVDGPDPQLDQMDPGIRRDRTVDAIIHILATESARQPVVLIFEDLHWIDTQTRVLLRRLVERITSERILVLATYRPEYERDWPAADHVTEIRLDPLDMDSSETLVSALLGKDPEISELKQFIVERAGGNPFFLEEIVNALSEDGTLSREGTAKLTKPLTELQMPMTVRGLLAERIDQMAPRSKEMLQILSVIGHRLPMALILRGFPLVHCGDEKDIGQSAGCRLHLCSSRHPGRREPPAGLLLQTRADAGGCLSIHARRAAAVAALSRRAGDRVDLRRQSERPHHISGSPFLARRRSSKGDRISRKGRSAGNSAFRPPGCDQVYQGRAAPHSDAA